MPVFRTMLLGLGGAAILIGTLIFSLGPSATGNIFSGLLARVTGLGGPITDLASPNVDSELRFYAVLWIAYGVIAVRTARTLPTSLRTAQVLLFVFFAGGLGRLFSVFSAGWPDLLFVVLMWIELALPLVLLVLSVVIERLQASRP